MASETGTRPLRVAARVREELALLLADEVRDPGAAGAVITRVEMNADLRSGRVYVRLLAGGDASAQKGLVEALGRASGMLRREVTRRLKLQFAPELRFFYDDGVDHVTRIEQVLADIEADRRSSKS